MLLCLFIAAVFNQAVSLVYATTTRFLSSCFDQQAEISKLEGEVRQVIEACTDELQTSLDVVWVPRFRFVIVASRCDRLVVTKRAVQHRS